MPAPTIRRRQSGHRYGGSVNSGTWRIGRIGNVDVLIRPSLLVMGLLLVFFHFALPFILLLHADMKRNPRVLAGLAGLVLNRDDISASTGHRAVVRLFMGGRSQGSQRRRPVGAFQIRWRHPTHDQATIDRLK